jgi:centromeric protein E
LHSYLGENNRKFGETAINEESSRSHTVFRVQFEIRPKERPDKVYFSFLNLIDLAGSEGVARAKTEGVRKK